MPTPLNRCLRLAAPALLLVQFAQATPLVSTLNRLAVSRFDSIGVERRDGRRYILHRVDQGQTLFAVARRYHVSIDAIRAANPSLTESGVRYDQLLHIPADNAPQPQKEPREADKVVRQEEKAARKEAKDKARLTAETERVIAAEEPPTATPRSTTRATGDGTHLVETGQTLYSLAARYGVSMADLRTWNNLGADGIQVGQTLIVSEKTYMAKGGTAKSATRKAGESADTRPGTAKSRASELAKLESKPLITPEPPLAPGSKPRPKKDETAETPRTPAAEATERTPAPRRAETETRPAVPKATEPSSNNEPVAATPKAKTGTPVKVQSEIGFADVIEGGNQSTKYLALHRSAPVGTLVQVRNDISNQSLYVKVIGKLPDTGLNDQVLIRLSSRAFEKLSPNGQRFRAEVSYAK